MDILVLAVFVCAVRADGCVIESEEGGAKPIGFLNRRWLRSARNKIKVG